MRCFLVAVLTFSLVSCASDMDSVRTYPLGTRVQTGPMVYTGSRAVWYSSLGSDANPRYPSNRFLIVHISVTNGGATDCTIPTLTLIGDSGQTYNELSDGSGVTDWLGVARRLRPLDSMSGTIAFDVPAGHYKLRVADETGQIVSDINLPVNAAPDGKGA